MLIDTYAWQARLKPALFVALPLALAVLALTEPNTKQWALLWAVVVQCGGTLFLAHFSRDMGKSREPELFGKWGGKPSTRILSHRGGANKITLERRHDALTELIAGIRMPTADEEERDPQGADHVYEHCGDFLREQTRDRKKFTLLFRENCSYGFRRNLWGMRPFGLATSAMGLALLLAFIVPGLWSDPRGVSPLWIGCAGVDLVLLAAWLIYITPNWVKPAADAYAERLFESIDHLSVPVRESQ